MFRHMVLYENWKIVVKQNISSLISCKKVLKKVSMHTSIGFCFAIPDFHKK